MVRQNGEEGRPGPHFFSVPLGHDTGHLGNVTEIMNYPGREQLFQGDPAQARMQALQVELGVAQVPGAQQLEVGGAEASELIQQGVERAIDVAFAVAEAVVGREGVTIARANEEGAGNPVGFLAIDEMADHIEGTEGVGPFAGAGPGLIDTVQHRREHHGSTSQDVGGLREVEVQGAILSSAESVSPIRSTMGQ